MSLRPYAEYKDSGVAWLGEVPAHWEMKPLWTLYRRSKRTNFPDEELLSVYRDFGVIPKSSRDDNNNRPSEDLSLYQFVNPGDLVINKMKAWQGSVAISEYRGIVSPAYFVYESLHSGDSRYFHYLMRSIEYTAGYLSISKGIRINQWDLEPQYHSRMPILVPSVDERKQIAKILDHETAKIDALIAEQEKLIALLAEKRQAVISHAVTKGLNPDAPMKDSSIPWLGEVPAHWDVKALRRVVSLNPSKSEVAHFPKDSEVSFLPMEAICENGDLILDRFRKLSEVETGYTYFRNGDVTIAKITPCFENGKGGVMTGLLNDFGFGTTELIVVRPDLNFISAGYLNCIFKSKIFRSESERSMYGAGGQKRVSDDFVRNLTWAIPPASEQNNIERLINTQSQQFELLKNNAQTAISLLKERRSALISAAVTGKIDVRNWQPEASAA
ncbi:restriction endonuclease subunit S [Chromobacterium violaceum]|uniref:Type I restriction enzyme EcoKI specificity protein n=1 Tax=Chromobacterium violaceum TaxID=536 RepID=A0AAX2MAS9_CHRVL|nr:restriction endonuclease subunit S [Chromobacterium violaceum]OLZ75108.1 hypothetical protein BS642_19410 [Chromobacterium violaceum]STB64793.1 Type I restriction enzyme EcoKI specificity protein [Chromobacterium violaceum]SUX33720.1 Type I restriction enzyme EcoKI specificity protein [Chromobacterium violaceum]